MLSTVCSMRVAPQIAVETAGFAQAQASASCATVQPAWLYIQIKILE